VSDYEIPEDCRYTEDDEWIRVDAGGARVGITDYAQQQLGDIVFVELGEPGDTLSQGDSFGAIESVKAVSDLYAPISGEVTAINEVLNEKPAAVNESCYSEGWLIELAPSDLGQLEALMSAASYRKYVAERTE
jgi:glycine cleavage system H protein